MDDKYLFIWLCWILWVIITFFLPKSNIRTASSIWLLLTMISSTTSIVLHDYLSVSVAFISLLFGGLVMYSFKKHWLYHMMAIFSLMLAYATLMFFMKVSPIIIVLSPMMMIVILSISLTTIFRKTLFHQLFILILGMSLGELTYGLVLNDYYMVYTIGHFSFLSVLIVAVICLLIWQTINQLRMMLFRKSRMMTKRSIVKRRQIS